MEILFKAAATIDSKTTVGATNFKQHYPFVEGSMLFTDLSASIRQATLLYIVPQVGLAMYEKIAKGYATNNLPDAAASVLMTLQDAIARYTIYLAFPYITNTLSSSGVQKQQPTSGATPMAFAEAKDARFNAHRDADNFLDMAILLIEASNSEFFDEFRTFAQSGGTSAFFQTADELTQYLNIQGNRRAFVAMLPHLKEVEQGEITKILGEEFFAQLQAASSEIWLKAADKVKKYTAQAALTAAVPYLTLVIEGDGFKVVSSGDSIEERSSLKNAQHERAILRLQDASRQKAEQYRADLLAFLWKYQSDFPAWLQSDFYKSLSDSGSSSQVVTARNGGVFLKF